MQHLLWEKIQFIKNSADPSWLRDQQLSLKDWAELHSAKAILEQALGIRYDVHGNARTMESYLSRELGGRRPLKIVDLHKLATHFRLPIAPFAERRFACSGLTDECPVDEFKRILVAHGMIDAIAASRGIAASRYLLLSALRAYRHREDGFEVGDDRFLTAAQLAPTRGGQLPQKEDSEPLHTFPVGARVGLRLDPAHTFGGMVLLEVGPSVGTSQAPRITALSPSLLIPSRDFPHDGILPRDERRVHNINRFVLGGPVGVYDWLAILTQEPLRGIPWSCEAAELPVLSLANLHWLFDALDTQQTRYNGTEHAPEIRHRTFRIGFA